MKNSPRSAAHRGRDGLSLLQQRLSASRNLFMEKELRDRRSTKYKLDFFWGEGLQQLMHLGSSLKPAELELY
jgi:hypothetical protein